MKVTLKTSMTYPRHEGVPHEPGETLDVPDEVAADWIKRDLAEKAQFAAPVTPAPKVEKSK